MKKLTNEEFKERAKKIHGDKYDYSLTNYVNTKEKVKIICPLHSEFFQTARDHLNGAGCPVCASAKRRSVFVKINKNKKLTNKEFENRTHNKYTISEQLNGTHKKIKFICNACGSQFYCLPSNILRHPEFEWCSNCSIGKSWTHEKFEKEARKIHGDKYDYSDVIYIRQEIKVKIICPEHGVFEQTPRMHLKGQGCPKCKESRGEKRISLWLNKNNIIFETQKTFEDLYAVKKNKYAANVLLKYDFYIPSKNLLIEYNGKQHYEPVEFFGGERQLKEQRHRDWLKRKYAKKHGIRLLTIPYWSDKILENILLENIENESIG